MIDNTPQNVTRLQFNNDTGEGEVIALFPSISDIIDCVLSSSSSIFEAIRATKEINEMNNCILINEYHIKQIKNHFKKREATKNSLYNGYAELLSQQVTEEGNTY